MVFPTLNIPVERPVFHSFSTKPRAIKPIQRLPLLNEEKIKYENVCLKKKIRLLVGTIEEQSKRIKLLEDIVFGKVIPGPAEIYTKMF